MLTRHDDQGFPRFPDGAAPQFDRPYRAATNDLRIIREGAVRGNATNRSRSTSPERDEPPALPTAPPPRRITRHLLIPNEIGILPTGIRYHFWPSCPHMMRARSSAQSRIYSVCQTCLNGARRVMHVVEAYDFPRPRPGQLEEPEPVD